MSSSAPAAPTAEIDLALAKTADPSAVSVGAQVTFRLVVTNVGRVTATRVTVVDDLPSGFTLVSTATLGSCTGTTRITCTVPDLAPGASATVTIVARAVSPGTFTNVAVVSGAESESNRENNTGRAGVRVSGPFTPPAGCALSISAPAKVVAGRTTIVRVIVRGAGGRPAAGIRVSARGAGVSATAVTNARGVATFRFRPRGVGVIRLVAAGAEACPARTRLVRSVAPFRPPKPKFTG